MPELPNGHIPKTIVTVNIQMLEDGTTHVQANGPESTLVFLALSQAQSQLCLKLKQQESQKIQVAPAGLINRLPNMG